MFLARTLLITSLAAVGLLVSPALAANTPGSETPIIDTHVPEPNEPVQYESSLAPGMPTAGSITAMDRYEWYCFKANSGVAIAITVDMASGGLQPNCGLLQGVVNDGVQVTNLGQILAATNSLSTTSVTLNYTPTFTGPVTLWVAGALSSIGNYNVTMTGGEQRSGCTPCPTCVVATAPPDDEAQFKVGTPTFAAPDFIDVPLLVDTHEGVTFTQMRIEYHSSCLTYVSTEIGDVTSPGVPFADDAPGAVDPGSNRHVQLNISGTYTGCSKVVFEVRFRFTPGHVLPCSIVWDPTLGGPNSNNHLNYTPGGDGKILPDDITFCDGEITCDPNVEIDGTVEYYSNGTPIIATRPDALSPPVTVEDCVDQMPTTTATSPNADYLLAFGTGPVSVDLCAKRPRVVCGTDEDGVISGDDVIALQNDVNPPPSTTDPKLRIAGDVNRDGSVNNTDVLAIKRWIGRKVCDGSDACAPSMMQIKNCSGTWRFIFFTDPSMPTVFETDEGNLAAVCNDATVPIEGILVGDFDGSWPNTFVPKAASPVDLALDVKGWEGEEVLLALRANLDAGESLRHVIYSLDYDATAFEYLGMQTGSKTSTWGWFDNPDNAGVAHGIAHIPPHAEALAESGEVIVFRLRARNAKASSAISFSRLKANDRDVVAPEIQVGRGNPVEAAPMPSQYSLTSKPNPFNPSTRVTFAIPDGAGSVPVVLRIFDVSGHVVRTLVEGARGPGYHHVVWDGDDALGNASSAGVYFLRIEAGTWSSVEKLTLVK